MAAPGWMVNAASSTAVSGGRGPTPSCSTITWPSPTTRSGAPVMSAKVSQPPRSVGNRRCGGRVGGREKRALQHTLRLDEALQRVDRLGVAGVGVVRAPEVVERLGA